MKRPPFLRACALLAALLLSSASLSQDLDSLSPQERQARLQELRSTIEQLQSDLENVRSERSEMLDELQESESQMRELNKKVEDLQKQLRDQQSRLRDLRSEQEALVSAKKQQQGSVAQHLNAAYRVGQQSHLKMLLNQQDPALVTRNLNYFNRLVTTRTEKIDQFEQTLTRLARIEPEIADTVRTMERQRSTLDRERKALAERQKERQNTLSRLEDLIEDKDQHLAAVETDRDNLQALLDRVVKVSRSPPSAASDAPFQHLKGQLPWPTEGELLHRYGSPRVAGKVNWQGMMISAQEGTPVHAIHQGRVVFSDYLRGHGLLLIIDHGAGFLSLYAHNQSLFKSLGDRVEGGEQIATVGVTGGQKSAGLYFELRHNGQPTNPHPWLRQA